MPGQNEINLTGTLVNTLQEGLKFLGYSDSMWNQRSWSNGSAVKDYNVGWIYFDILDKKYDTH